MGYDFDQAKVEVNYHDPTNTVADVIGITKENHAASDDLRWGDISSLFKFGAGPKGKQSPLVKSFRLGLSSNHNYGIFFFIRNSAIVLGYRCEAGYTCKDCLASGKQKICFGTTLIYCS